MSKAMSSVASDFFKSCRDYEFPTGNPVTIFSTAEEKLIDEGRTHIEGLSRYALNLVDNIEWTDAYTLAILGLRLAVLAAKTTDKSYFKIAVSFFIAGGQKLDYRDSLRGLSSLNAARISPKWTCF